MQSTGHETDNQHRGQWWDKHHESDEGHDYQVAAPSDCGLTPELSRAAIRLE